MSRHKRSHTTDNPLTLKPGSNPNPVYGGDRLRMLQDKIQESNHLIEQIKLTQWQRSFQYITIPTDQFQSVFLEGNPHFNLCINIIKEYNEEVVSCKENNQEMRNGPWKLKFNNQLQGLLREIVFTRDRIIQKSFCEKVCAWAIYQLEQLEVAGETQHNQTMESLYAKAMLNRPESTSTALPSTNHLGSRILSAANKSINKSPKSGVLRNLDKSLLPQLNSTAVTMKPESSFNLSMRPESAAFYSKIDGIRPDSSIIFKNIRPDSSFILNAKMNRPFSSILKPETTFIKEDKEGEEDDQFRNGKDLSPIQYPNVLQDVNASRYSQKYDLDNEIDRKLYEEFMIKEEFKRNQREKIKIDFQASSLQPSQQIEQQLEDYKIKARTKIPEIEPPAQRIRSYTRKKLIPDNLVPNFDGEGEKDNKKKQEKVNWTFPKPDILLPSQQQALEEAEQKKLEEEQQALEQSEQPAQAGIQEEQNDLAGDVGQNIIKEAKAEKEKKEINIVPDVKNFLIDANSKEQFVRNLNNKFEQRSTYVYYEPTNDVREMRMEQKWLQNRNKELNDKRSDEEKIAMIKEWSHAKGRLEKEINRKIESTVYGSQYVKCDYKQRPCSAKRLREIDRVTLPKINQSNSFYQGIYGEETNPVGFNLQKEHRSQHQNQSNQKEEEEDEEEEEYYDEESNEGEEQDEEINENPIKKMEEGAGKENIDDQKKVRKVVVIGQYRGVNMTKSTNVIDVSKIIATQAKTDRYARFENEIHDLEYYTSKQKIMQIRELYGATINIPKSKELEDERQEVKTSSLSVYSKDRRNQLSNPFSAILTRAGTNVVRKEQIEEIEEVKKRLAKYNLNVPLKSMKNAILIPEGHLGVDADLIPEPGYGLFSNPFCKTKKKKKKGKKKSKK